MATTIALTTDKAPDLTDPATQKRIYDEIRAAYWTGRDRQAQAGTG